MHRIDLLHLIPQLYPGISVATEVYNAVVIARSALAGVAQIRLPVVMQVFDTEMQRDSTFPRIIHECLDGCVAEFDRPAQRDLIFTE